MLLGIISHIHPIFLAIIFVLFIVVIKKVFDIFTSLLWMAMIGAAFPFVMNFIGITVPITITNIIFFSMCATGLYLVYKPVHFFYKLVSGPKK